MKQHIFSEHTSSFVWIAFLAIIGQIKKDDDILHLSSDLQRVVIEIEINMWSRQRDYPCIYVQA